MELITKLENQYTRNQLYNYCKDKNISGCSRLKKNDLAKAVANYLTKNKKIQKLNTKLFNFDDSIFSNEKPEQLPPRRDRNIEIRDGTTASWKNMIHDYEIYCESAKNDLITFLSKVTEKLYEIATKELKIKNSISFQLVAVVDYIEVNLAGEQVNLHRKHFRSTRNIIVHSSAIKSALTSAKNEVLRTSIATMLKIQDTDLIELFE